MAKNLVQKIFEAHRVKGSLVPGEEIAIKIDQTLTQDATGTMAYLQFEAVGIPRVQTKISVSYVDHNMLQTGFENFDDHKFLQSIASKYGIYFSRPGNGICHQVHLERFGVPGATLLGSDSHTPTSGGIGCISIGAGGLDVAVAMGGGPFYLTMPRIIGVRLKGQLRPWVAAKDIILEMLRRFSVKGGVGKIFEYHGEGVLGLTVPERGTITNMGADFGATTSIFPSDEMTRLYMRAQGREQDWQALGPDPDAAYDELVEIDLNELEPLIAKPHSPDNVSKVSEVAGLKVDQVVIGSCTNSSYADLMTVAAALKGRHVADNCSLVIAPGSRQVLTMIARNGALADLIAAGARIIESACGPCIGMGQAPPSGGVSLRSFNRNYEGRSGTADAKVYLCSPETCVAAAITGVITDPRTLGEKIEITLPEKYLIDDGMVIPPALDPSTIEVVRGPNIKPLPVNTPLPDKIEGELLLKVGDNITTDHIMPAGAKILPLRSNIPAISQYVFSAIDPTFANRAKRAGAGFIIGGENYGQGSSREHAALAPMFLGVKAVIVKSFARIHKANLINFGILPLTFKDPADYDRLQQGDTLEFTGLHEELQQHKPLRIRNISQGYWFDATYDLTPRQIEIILQGGLLNHTKHAHGTGKLVAPVNMPA
ncbi:MAG: aconitate hydratase [Chloroflexi bacterium]|nr:aconitate hydratase [Chloroflexota bacterium]